MAVVEIHNIKVKQECRFGVVVCTFKNKAGFWQTIPFNKLSKTSLKVDRDSYNGIVSRNGSYSQFSHGKKYFNVNGTNKITCNTDFLPEDYNLLFDELMLSELVYLNDVPVNLLPDTFERKTKLNNKMIQYTMDFEFSNDYINQVI